jgi:thiol:disulfide interchange protein
MRTVLIIVFTFLLLAGAVKLFLTKPQVPVQNPPESVLPIEPSVTPPEIKEAEPMAPIELPEFTSYTEAVAAAKTHNRPLFIYFTADWCHWCRVMKTGTLSDAQVKEKLSKEYVVAFIDTGADRATTRKYSVRGIPAYFVASKDEEVTKKATGAKSKEEFLAWLETGR